MEELLIYIAKSSVLTGIFILVYLLLLKNDTSFEMNRKFLLGGIFASFILPLIQFTKIVVIENAVLESNFPISEAAAGIPVQQAAVWNWWEIAGMIYFIGIAFLSIRFLLQLISLWRNIQNQPKRKDGKFIFVSSAKKVQPFSFFRYIVYNPQLHSSPELEMILNHEKIHARQWHSVDVLLSNLATIFLWCNPFIWIYKKYLIQNLEFIADRGTVATSVSKKAYQQTLVKVSVANFQPALSNLFYQSLIKKRIIMLNKNSTQKSPFWKLSLVIPFLFIFMFLFQVKTVAQVDPEVYISGVGNTSVEISTTITQFATEEDLKDVEKMFEDQGATIEFNNLKFTTDGRLTDMNATFESQDHTQSGNFSFNNPEGIPSYKISLKDGKFSIEKAESEKPEMNKGKLIYEKIGQNPLFILAGKEYKTEELFGKQVSIDGELNVITPKQAEEKYGAKGEDGVLIISEGKISKAYENSYQESGSEHIIKDFIVVMEGKKPMFMHMESHITKKAKGKQNNPKVSKFEVSKVEFYQDDINASENGNKNSIHSFNQSKNSPLFVINGKVQKKNFKVNSIETEEIESITVLKDKKAIEKYGKRAKNGVIEITTKSKKD